MLVRIRFGEGRPIRGKRGKNRRLALAAASLMVPAAMMPCALGAWRLAADLGLASEFAVRGGPFSHWQVWMAVTGALIWLAVRLNRYGRGGGTA